MTWLGFFAAVVEALAWPITAVVLLLLLREPLKRLIPLMQRLRYKDFELEFGRRLEEAKSEVDAADLPDTLRLPPGEHSAFIERIAKIAQASPQAAVLDAWREVETATVAAAVRHGYAGEGRHQRSMPNLLRSLRESLQADPSILALVDDLRALRNQAAHASDFAIGSEAAMEYGFLAERVIGYFRNW